MDFMHWFAGFIGNYPSYLLGAIIAAQLMEKMREEIPALDEQIEEGKMNGWKDWLKRNIHQEGATHQDADMLLDTVLNKYIDQTALLAHLKKHFLNEKKATTERIR
jgi:carboxypeptidase Taq